MSWDFGYGMMVGAALAFVSTWVGFAVWHLARR